MDIMVDLYNRIKLTVFDAYFLLSFSRGKRNIVISFFFPEDLPGDIYKTCAQGTNIRDLKIEV